MSFSPLRSERGSVIKDDASSCKTSKSMALSTPLTSSGFRLYFFSGSFSSVFSFSIYCISVSIAISFTGSASITPPAPATPAAVSADGGPNSGSGTPILSFALSICSAALLNTEDRLKRVSNKA